MSHVDLRKWACRMSQSFLILCRMSLSLMSPVDFKKMTTSNLRVEGHVGRYRCLTAHLEI